MRLRGKKALITGGGRGIGRASALRFAQEGASVCVLDIDIDAARETVALLKNAGLESVAIQADISQSDEVQASIEEAKTHFGSIDILYNNAAVTSLLSTLEMTDEELDRVFAINIKSMFYTCRAVLPEMIRSRSGAIVNNASITGIVGAPGMAAYAASKGAIISLTRTLALEQAENGIRVNCICPGSIDTPMLQRSFDRTPDPEASRARNIRRHPLGRLGTPEDVANLALFLASDEASFITGATYTVDGGAVIARRWQD
jgi:NAD(P)-dependent dehydrogenase (short-subunit alcohol dehydrogenase family)